MPRRERDLLSQCCVNGVPVNVKHCLANVQNGIGLATALNPALGYNTTSRIAKQALTTGRSVTDLLLVDELLPPELIADLLNPENLVGPSRSKRFKEYKSGESRSSKEFGADL